MMGSTQTATAAVPHLSHRERSDRIARCGPGEGLRSTEFAAPPHPALRADLSPTGRGGRPRP
ncbi:hypothetical protein XH86_33720 [Bradyrhizobium guangdongense]|uniref:Propionyl-coenzyme A carboxylase alpha polypeptide n=1 Tax=Bradyrhizobium guangdongense TaxID=1325090 RepID=A0ABX6UPK3_9BRAD|nr:hypothetical protein X265_33685 [Bradyrhizobium guangdongense]QOZ63142.1 hypothetical protein XH86_33720 [Bradyrhizobium guangdongense]